MSGDWVGDIFDEVFPQPASSNVVKTLKDRNKTETETRQNGPSDHMPDGIAEKPFSVRPFAALWGEVVGSVNYGRFGKALKPVVDMVGMDTAIEAFRRFCHTPDIRYGPEFFASHFRLYQPKMIQIYTPNGEMTPEAYAILSKAVR